MTRRSSQSTSSQPQRTQLAPRWLHFGAWATLVTLLSLALWLGNWRWSAFLDNVALDALFSLRGSHPPAQVAEELPQSKDIIIIELSHETPRPVLARLLVKLREARAVGLDFMFSDRERDLMEEERPFYKKEIIRWKREDQELARSMALAGNIVLGAWPFPMPSDAQVRPQTPGAVRGIAPQRQWSLPAPILAQVAKAQSHLCVVPDVQDGLIRRVRPFEMVSGQKRPCFALALATLARHRTPHIESRALNEADPESGILIDYLGPRAVFEYDTNRITFDRALQMAEPEDFKDKIVLVGQTDERSKDIFSTPWGDMPGLLIHANIVATLLSSSGPPQNLPPLAVFAISLLLSLLLVAALTRFPVWFCAPLALVGMGAAVVIMASLFVRTHTILPLSVPVGALLGTYNGIAIYEYLRARRTLGHVVGPRTAALLLDDVSRLHLGGRLQEATAFFCDLRGYATLSQRIPPQQLIELLNFYTAALVNEMHRFNGRTIDYFGDGVFVLFEGKGHAARSVKAALAAQGTVDELMEAMRREARGHPSSEDRSSKTSSLSQSPPKFDPPLTNPEWLDTLRVGIALHTGSMVIGLVGANDRFKPGAVGDAVNVAARLQALTPVCGYPVLISRATLEAWCEDEDSVLNAVGEAQDVNCNGITAHFCGIHTIRGREGDLEVFGLGKAY